MLRSARRGQDAANHMHEPASDCTSLEQILYYELSKWDKSISEKENKEENEKEANMKFNSNKSKRQFSLSWCLLKKLRSVRVRKTGVNSNTGLTEAQYCQQHPKNKTIWQQGRQPQLHEFEQVERLEKGRKYCEGHTDGCELLKRIEGGTWKEPEWQQKKRMHGSHQSQTSEQHTFGELRQAGWQPGQQTQTQALLGAPLASPRFPQSARNSQEPRWRPVAQAASCGATPALARLRARSQIYKKRRSSLRDSNRKPREKPKMVGSRVKELPSGVQPTRPTGPTARAQYDSLQHYDVKTSCCIEKHKSKTEMQVDEEGGGGRTLIAAPAQTLMARLWVAAATDSTRPASEFTTTTTSKTSTEPADLKTSTMSTETGDTAAWGAPGASSVRGRGGAESTLSALSTRSSESSTLSESSSLSDSSDDVDPSAPSYLPANERVYWFFRNRRTLGVQTAREGRAPGHGTALVRAGHVWGGGRLRMCPHDEQEPPPPHPPLVVTALEDTAALTTLASRFVASTGHCFTELQKKIFSQNSKVVKDKTRSQYTQYKNEDIQQKSIFPVATSQYRVTIEEHPEVEEHSGRARTLPSCACDLKSKGASCLRADAALSTSGLNQPKKNTIPKKKIPIWKRYFNCWQKKQPVCICLSKKKTGKRCLFCKNNLECECTGNIECQDCRQTHEVKDPFLDANFIKLIEDDVNYRNALENKNNIFRLTNTLIKAYESDRRPHHHTERASRTPRQCYWHKGDPNAKCTTCKVSPPVDLFSNLPCVCQPLTPPEEKSQDRPCKWKYKTEDGVLCSACYKPMCKCQCESKKKFNLALIIGNKKLSIPPSSISQKQRADVAEPNEQNIYRDTAAKSQLTPEQHQNVNKTQKQMALQDNLEQSKPNALSDIDIKTQPLHKKTWLRNSVDKALSAIRLSMHDVKSAFQDTLTKSPSMYDQQQYIDNKENKEMAHQDDFDSRQREFHSQKVRGSPSSKSHLDGHLKDVNVETQSHHKRLGTRNALDKASSPLDLGRSIGWSSSTSKTGINEPPENKTDRSSSPMSISDERSGYQDPRGELLSKTYQQQHPGITQYKQMARQDDSVPKPQQLSPFEYDENNKQAEINDLKRKKRNEGDLSLINIHRDNLNSQDLHLLNKDESTCCRTIFKNFKHQGTNSQSSEDLLNSCSSSCQSYTVLDEDKCFRIGKLIELKSVNKSKENHKRFQNTDQISNDSKRYQILEGTEKNTKNVKSLLTKNQETKNSREASSISPPKRTNLEPTYSQNNSNNKKTIKLLSEHDKNKTDYKTYQPGTKNIHEDIAGQQEKTKRDQDVTTLSAKNQKSKNSLKLSDFPPTNSSNLEYKNTQNGSLSKADKNKQRDNKTTEAKREVFVRKAPNTSLTTKFKNHYDVSQKSPSQYGTHDKLQFTIDPDDNIHVKKGTSPYERSKNNNTQQIKMYKKPLHDNVIRDTKIINTSPIKDKNKYSVNQETIPKYPLKDNANTKYTAVNEANTPEVKNINAKTSLDNTRRIIKPLQTRKESKPSSNKSNILAQNEKSVIRNRTYVPQKTSKSITTILSSKTNLDYNSVKSVSCQCNIDDVKVLKKPLNRSFQGSSNTKTTKVANLPINNVNQQYEADHQKNKYTKTNTYIPNHDNMEEKRRHIFKTPGKNSNDDIRTKKFNQDNNNMDKFVTTTNSNSKYFSKDIMQNKGTQSLSPVIDKSSNLSHLRANQAKISQTTNTEKNSNTEKNKNQFNAIDEHVSRASSITDIEGIKRQRIDSKNISEKLPPRFYIEKHPVTRTGKPIKDSIQLNRDKIRMRSKNNTKKDSYSKTYEKNANQRSSRASSKSTITNNNTGGDGKIIKGDKEDTINLGKASIQLKEPSTTIKKYHTSNQRSIPKEYNGKANPEGNSTKEQITQGNTSFIRRNIQKLPSNEIHEIPTQGSTIPKDNAPIMTLPKEENSKSINKAKNTLESMLEKLGDALFDKQLSKSNYEEIFEKNDTKTDAMPNTSSSTTIERKCSVGCNCDFCDLEARHRFSPDFIPSENKEYSISKNYDVRCLDEIEIKTSPYINRIGIKNTVAIASSPSSVTNRFFDDIMVIKYPSHNQSNHSSIEYSMPSKVYQVERFDQDNTARFNSTRITADKNIYSGSCKGMNISFGDDNTSKGLLLDTAVKTNKIKQHDNKLQNYITYTDHPNKKKGAVQCGIEKNKLHWRDTESDTPHENLKTKSNDLQAAEYCDNFVTKIVQREDPIRLGDIKKRMQYNIAVDTSTLSNKIQNISPRLPAPLANVAEKNKNNPSNTKLRLTTSRGTSCHVSQVKEKFDLCYRSKENSNIEINHKLLPKQIINTNDVFPKPHNVDVQSSTLFNHVQMYNDISKFTSSYKCLRPFLYGAKTNDSVQTQHFIQGEKAQKRSVVEPVGHRSASSSEKCTGAGAGAGAASLARQRPGRHTLRAVADARASRGPRLH